MDLKDFFWLTFLEKEKVSIILQGFSEPLLGLGAFSPLPQGTRNWLDVDSLEGEMR